MAFSGLFKTQKGAQRKIQKGATLKNKKGRILKKQKKGEPTKNSAPPSLTIFVIPLRFERRTHALEGRCSIQLSYGTNLLLSSTATKKNDGSVNRVQR